MFPIVTLNRLVTNSSGCFGVLIYEKNILCYTLELPWRGNIKNKSCVPCGTYDLSKSYSSGLGNVFRFNHVPGRSGILIHSGNTIEDTEGCILPGLDISDFGVVSSRSALGRLLISLPPEFQLDIREV